MSALPPPFADADYEAGRRLAAQCRSCHLLTADGPGRVGPPLGGVFGRRAGSVEGFAYSEAMKNANFAWDAERLDQWLANPRDFLPGNRMSFPGVPNVQDRTNLIAFLMIETKD